MRDEVLTASIAMLGLAISSVSSLWVYLTIKAPAAREARLRRHSGVALQMSVVATIEIAGKQCLCVEVLVANEGDNPILVLFDKNALSVATVVSPVEGLVVERVESSGPWHNEEGGAAQVDYRLFRAHQSRRMVFVVRASGSGVDLLQVQVRYCSLTPREFQNVAQTMERDIRKLSERATIVAFEQMAYVRVSRKGARSPTRARDRTDGRVVKWRP